MVWLYFCATFLSSCLLFLVQPMCAKMLLPLLGGSPAVWNTCMVFFQAGLLVGYAIAHALPRWLGVGRHAILHLGLMIAAYFLLPIRFPDDVPTDLHPAVWLIGMLTLAVGLPFVLLSAGTPLVQRWFLAKHHATPRDPYVLYAASNVGSFLALGLFPFLLEPNFSLSAMSEIWRLAFLVLAALLAFCVPLRAFTATDAVSATPTTNAPNRWTRLRWIALAMVPSSLMLSVTTHLTTDIAAVPLFWLLPIALYLGTFVLVFAGKPFLPHSVLIRWQPMVVIVMLFVYLSEANDPLTLVMGVQLVGFFWLAMVCHGELARTKPGADRITEFYLCLAFGGVLGGAFNALLAPVLFNGLAEYPLMIVLACLIGLTRDWKLDRADFLAAGAVGAITAAFVYLVRQFDRPPFPRGPIEIAIIFGGPFVYCYISQARPIRLALCLASVLLASWFHHGIHGTTIYQTRSWFGIHRVTSLNGFTRLVHGNTVHGQQDQDRDYRHLPLTYYANSGPIGEVFHAFNDDPQLDHVGVVGLGTGSLAAYSKPGQAWTFFEIDPAVRDIALNPRLFTFLYDAKGTVKIDIGDARLSLKRSTQKFGLLVIDAFGSDAIPLHLLTREALAIYLGKLTPNGVIALHFSNRYVDLEPVLAALADDALPTCVALVRRHQPTSEETRRGIMPSDWLVLARDERHLGKLVGWEPARPRPGLKAWTDDTSNLFQALRW
ncbi:MAG: hypothetical protein EXS16_06890 [Gemmataceae bacterium]|nr:hypothetical protein [Gemmataceae bacterium]